MSDGPQKDFGLIADDYSFFESNATEAEADARTYVEELRGVVPATGPLRMLDFGCGTGTFTMRFLRTMCWGPERLQLTLMEPVESVRREAVTRLASFSGTPLVESDSLQDGWSNFDVILANHVFYYVPELRGQLARLIASLSASGVFVTAVAARSNALIGIWIAGFRLLDKDIPYHTSEDVESALRDLNANFTKREVSYELTFPDTEENRMRILRFLLADHLEQMPVRSLLDLFNQYSQGSRILIRTTSDHYLVRAQSGQNAF
jgi:trans-aconitate 2-methyltransferase